MNPVEFITRASMERATFETWYPFQYIYNDTNDLNNEETMTKILQGTGLTSEYLQNDPEATRTKKLMTFDDVDLEKYCGRSQRQDDETSTY